MVGFQRFFVMVGSMILKGSWRRFSLVSTVVIDYLLHGFFILQFSSFVLLV